MQILNTEALHHGLDKEISKKILDDDNYQAYKLKNLSKSVDQSKLIIKETKKMTKVKFEKSDLEDNNGHSFSSFS